MRSRFPLWISIGLAALAGISLGFSPVRQAGWTALFLKDFMAGESPSLFKLLTREPVITSGILTVNDTLRVPFDLYHCPASAPVAAIVFTHGLAHRGNQDPRVQEQSRRLARAGFVVMAPELQQMKNYQLGFQDVAALIAAVEYLRALPGVDSTRIGIVAPSFGAGQALIALSQSRIRDRVQFALIFGGYYDLRRTLRYTLTGAYEAEGAAGRVDLTANRHNRWKFLRGNAGLLSPSPSREEYLQFAAAKIEDPFLDIRPVLPHFSDEEQRLLVFVDNEDPFRFDALYAALPLRVRAWVDTLSLYHYTADIHAQLLIAHSQADDKVSFTESLALSRHLPSAPPPRVYLIGLFSHVDLALSWNSLSAVWGELLPGMEQLWSLADHLLRQRP